MKKVDIQELILALMRFQVILVLDVQYTVNFISLILKEIQEIRCKSVDYQEINVYDFLILISLMFYSEDTYQEFSMLIISNPLFHSDSSYQIMPLGSPYFRIKR